MVFGDLAGVFKKREKSDEEEIAAPSSQGMGTQYIQEPLSQMNTESPMGTGLAVGQRVRVYQGERARKGIVLSKEDSGNYRVKLDGMAGAEVIRPPDEIEDLAKVKNRGMRIVIGRG